MNYLLPLLLVSLLAFPAFAQFSVTPEVAVTAPELGPSDRAGQLAGSDVLDVAAGGDLFLVVWQEKRADLTSDIFAARVTRTGELLDPSGIVVATLDERIETAPRVLWTGSRFLVTWVVLPFSVSPVTMTRAAEIDVNGRVLPRDGVELVQGRVVDLAVSASRTMAVVERGSDVLIGAIDSTSRFTQIAAYSNAVRPQIAAYSGGFVAFWFVADSFFGRYHVELQRFATDGTRIGGVQPWGELGTITGAPSSAAASSGNEAVIAIGGQNVLRAGRLTSDALTLDINITSGHHVVTDVVHRGSGYDVLDVQDGQLVAHRFGAGVFPATGAVVSARGDASNDRTLLAWITRDNQTQRQNVIAAFMGESSQIVVSRAAANQQGPALATDGNTVLGVWTEDRGEAADALIARRMTLDGTPFGAAIPVTDGARPVKTPSVAFNGSDYLVVWHEFRFPTEELYQHVVSRRVTRDGVAADVVVISSTANVDARPRTATDGNNVLIVWADGAYSAPRLRAALFAPNRYITPASIALPAKSAADVVWNGESYFVVAETNENSVRGMLVSAEGVLLGSNDVTTGPGRNPSVAWSGSSHLVVYERANAIYGRFIDRTGGRISTDFLLHGNDGWRYSGPRVAWDGTSFVVTFERSRPESYFGYHDLYIARVAPGVSSAVAATPLSATPYHDAGATLLPLPGRRTLLAYQRIVPEVGFVQRVFTRTLGMVAPTGRRRVVEK